MVDELKNLADEANELFKDHGPSQRFSEGCELLLQKLNFSLEALESLHETVFSMRLPRQHFSHDRFSDYAVTLARSGNCFLDLYIWSEKSTSYHSHHFCGAFKVISGAARQARLTFSPQKDLESLQLGKLTLDETRDLMRGDTQPILIGSDFIHKNHYVSRPGATLCLRSENIPEQKIFTYFYPGVALADNKISAGLSRKLKLAEFLYKDYKDPSSSKEMVKKTYTLLPLWFKYDLLLGFGKSMELIQEPSLRKELACLAEMDEALDKEAKAALELMKKEHPRRFQRDMLLLESFGWSKGG